MLGARASSVEITLQRRTMPGSLADLEVADAMRFQIGRLPDLT